jgi:hypothetical protein
VWLNQAIMQQNVGMIPALSTMDEPGSGQKAALREQLGRFANASGHA